MKKLSKNIQNIKKKIELIDLEDIKTPKFIRTNEKLQSIISYLYLAIVVIIGIVLVIKGVFEYKIWIILFPIITTVCLLWLYSIFLVTIEVFKIVCNIILNIIIWLLNFENIKNTIKSITKKQILFSIVSLTIILLFYKQIVIVIKYIFILIYIVLSFINNIYELFIPTQYQ